MKTNIQLPRVDYELIKLDGGLDQITPTLSLSPGAIRRGANFECALSGGYKRVAGYERFDGHPSPSDAQYGAVLVTLVADVPVGSIIVGALLGASAKVIATLPGKLIVTRRLGIMSIGETIKVAGNIVGTITSLEGIDTDGKTDAQYKALAAADYRADIGAVPGEGRILGVCYYNGTMYAWRNNVGSTAAKIYKSSAAGWVVIDLGLLMRFYAGTAPYPVVVGDVIRGRTSGATALVNKITYSETTPAASGVFIVTNVTGTFTMNETLERVSNLATAGLVQSIPAPITLLPNGRVRTQIANFGGGAANRKIYGCDGVNRGFEFDGTTYVPITTYNTVDTPTRVAVHKNHLFFAFGNSLQNSSIGTPFDWAPLTGASEISLNSNITNLLPLPGDQSSGAMAVYTETDTAILYGSSTADFALSAFNTGTGARNDSAQTLDQCYALSNRGVIGLGATLNFGNFAGTSLTNNLVKFLAPRLQLATASTVSRDRGQYRAFFSDGYALYMTMSNGNYVGAMPVQYPNPALCTCEGLDTSGNETSFFGSSNGFVYQMDAGTSFDGEEIQANMTLVYNSIRAPRIKKSYRAASIELTGDGYCEFSFGYDIGYGSSALVQAQDTSESKDLRSAYWDEMVWDNFVFDGQALSPSEAAMSGTAENVAIRISSVSSILQTFTLNSIIIHYTPRRGLRQQ